MISKEAWWEVFRHYNKTIFPLQWILWGAVILVSFYTLNKPSEIKNRTALLFSSICAVFCGLCFFIIIGTGLPSPMRFIQGGLFIAISLFLALSAIKKKPVFSLPKNGADKFIFVILLTATLLYPVFGVLRGHGTNQLIYPGALPCATTAFILLMASTDIRRSSKLSILLLLIWAIPFAPLIQIPIFGAYEDSIMFLAGVYMIIKWIIASFHQRKVEQHAK